MISALDLSADAGLAAVVAATLNILIGLLIWGRYSPVRWWPYRRFDVFRIHRWTGYAAAGLTLLHPLPLLLLSKPHFRLLDVALPLWSPEQPVENTLGAAALYLVVIVIATSLYRIRLGRKLWKNFHYLTYAAAAALFAHGLLTDQHLNNSPLDLADGEKVLVEVCLALVVAAAFWRLRQRGKKFFARVPPAAQPKLEEPVRR